MSEPLDKLQEDLSYRFRDVDLLQRALTHASMAAAGEIPNERLEFLGDAVLELVVAEELYRSHPALREGRMTAIKSGAVSEKTLGRIAGELGLARYLRVDKSLGQRERYPHSLLADAYEAVLAAVYLDGGLGCARDVVMRTLGPALKEVWQDAGVRDHKSALQQAVQAAGKPPPSYHTLRQKGPDHDKTFVVAVSMDGAEAARGRGKTKKEAEQEAARRALEQLSSEERNRGRGGRQIV